MYKNLELIDDRPCIVLIENMIIVNFNIFN
jgi:hypothetical protein